MGLLDRNPSTRLTASRALQHPFLAPLAAGSFSGSPLRKLQAAAQPLAAHAATASASEAARASANGAQLRASRCKTSQHATGRNFGSGAGPCGTQSPFNSPAARPSKPLPELLSTPPAHASPDLGCRSSALRAAQTPGAASCATSGAGPSLIPNQPKLSGLPALRSRHENKLLTDTPVVDRSGGNNSADNVSPAAQVSSLLRTPCAARAIQLQKQVPQTPCSPCIGGPSWTHSPQPSPIHPVPQLPNSLPFQAALWNSHNQPNAGGPHRIQTVHECLMPGSQEHAASDRAHLPNTTPVQPALNPNMHHQGTVSPTATEFMLQQAAGTCPQAQAPPFQPPGIFEAAQDGSTAGLPQGLQMSGTDASASGLAGNLAIQPADSHFPASSTAAAWSTRVQLAKSFQQAEDIKPSVPEQPHTTSTPRLSSLGEGSQNHQNPPSSPQVGLGHSRHLHQEDPASYHASVPDLAGIDPAPDAGTRILEV